jgi:hypothetical protein
LVQFFREFEVSTPCLEKPWREENMGIMMYYDHWLNIRERETNM